MLHLSVLLVSGLMAGIGAVLYLVNPQNAATVVRDCASPPISTEFNEQGRQKPSNF